MPNFSMSGQCLSLTISYYTAIFYICRDDWITLYMGNQNNEFDIGLTMNKFYVV